MKKSSKIILLCAVCLLSLGIVLSVIGLFSGASLNRIIDSGLWNYTFYQEDDYDNDHSKDNTYRIETDRLDSLSIDWISGSVSVISYDGKDILLEESSEEKIDGETACAISWTKMTSRSTSAVKKCQFNFRQRTMSQRL